MSDAIGSKNTCKTFSTELFGWRIQSKKSSFSTGSASRNSQSKKVESRKPVFDCVRKPDLGFSRKRPFSIDKFDCIRNGLIVEKEAKKYFSEGGNWTKCTVHFCSPYHWFINTEHLPCLARTTCAACCTQHDNRPGSKEAQEV